MKPEKPVSTGDTAWREGHVPFSNRFDDIYFSAENGLAESRYVFVDHCLLAGPERMALPEDRPLVVGETGFGTGLNFLALWTALEEEAQTDGRPLPAILFQSTELYPLEIEDHCKAVMYWQDALGGRAEQFCDQLGQGSDAQGLDLSFDNGRIRLQVVYKDVTDGISHFAEPVDAWFLDGFAPAKNPDMWRQDVFDAMADKSRDKARFATFTAAGFVKRGLRQSGFVTEKVRGYGRKRDMLRGYFNPAEAATLYA